MRTGTAELPLHGGHCPPWLFERMKRLGRAVVGVIVEEFGRRELLRRMGDPFFFQSLGCALGYDWHSSGLSTVTLGALKEALDPRELGVAVCGGKGRASRRTPEEIRRAAELFSLPSGKAERLEYASRMAAKVDSACVQDGYQLYHHCFLLTEDGDWAVIQQGMRGRWARRYHWVSEGVRSFVEEPHSGIAGERREEVVLDLTARESEGARRGSLELAKRDPSELLALGREAEQTSLDEYLGLPPGKRLVMPEGHGIPGLSVETLRVLRRVQELDPGSYEELVAVRGVGPRTLRALALLSALVYGKPPCWRDPVRYSFAVGGKDGVPFPVDRRHYDEVVEFLQLALEEARADREEKRRALRRLASLVGT
ncbi:MAG: DUF763 domain-containing protein [Hadesarchaea archaeon]|jgi:hypothetical protein|nr:MAG: DUF763 domain-containing protein [Hadesarchaea archaeon]